MSVITANVNGRTSNFESGRPLSGGVTRSDFATLIRDLANCAAPNVVTVTCAANATVNLVSVFNTILTTANGTIANAILNFPTGATDGELCRFVTTGAVSNVTGSVNTAIPAVVSTSAGVALQFRFDATSSKWICA